MPTVEKQPSVPIIDFKQFVHGNDKDRQSIADEIKTASSGFGIFYLRNHGVPAKLLQSIFLQSKRFFDLSLDEKNKISVDMTLRGYTGNMKELVSLKATKADVKECFTLMLELPSDDEYLTLKGAHLYGPNKWPENLPGFRECVYEEYFKELTVLAHHMREAFALSLNLPASHFDSITEKPITTLRFNHYLKLPTVIDEEQVSCGVHTDNDAFTILAQDDVGGLQSKSTDGTFLDVAPLKDTLVVNVGDLLERWSNGEYKAPEHRVIAPPGKERHSISYHFGADYNAMIESCMKDEPSKYTPTTAGDYFESIEIPAHLFTKTM